MGVLSVRRNSGMRLVRPEKISHDDLASIVNPFAVSCPCGPMMFRPHHTICGQLKLPNFRPLPTVSNAQRHGPDDHLDLPTHVTLPRWISSHRPTAAMSWLRFACGPIACARRCHNVRINKTHACVCFITHLSHNVNQMSRIAVGQKSKKDQKPLYLVKQTIALCFPYRTFIIVAATGSHCDSCHSRRRVPVVVMSSTYAQTPTPQHRNLRLVQFKNGKINVGNDLLCRNSPSSQWRLTHVPHHALEGNRIAWCFNASAADGSPVFCVVSLALVIWQCLHVLDLPIFLHVQTIPVFFPCTRNRSNLVLFGFLWCPPSRATGSVSRCFLLRSPVRDEMK